jgi:hypothetical protein
MPILIHEESSRSTEGFCKRCRAGISAHGLEEIGQLCEMLV